MAGFSSRLLAVSEWMRRHPHAAVPRGMRARCLDGSEFDMGVWVMNLRADARAGRLSPERLAAAEAVPGLLREPWQSPFPGRAGPGYRALLEHVRLTRAARPPAQSLAGRFVAARRRDRRAGRLSQDQIQALEALPGFSWERHPPALSPPSQMPWIHYRNLLEVLATHGRVTRNLVARNLPRSTVSWVESLVSQHRAGTADPEIVTLISALPGWDWDGRLTVPA